MWTLRRQSDHRPRCVTESGDYDGVACSEAVCYFDFAGVDCHYLNRTADSSISVYDIGVLTT